MKQYLDLVRHIRDNGARKSDRTGTGTLSVFGIPVATFAIGNAGAANAGLFAAAMLATEYPRIGDALESFRTRQTPDVIANDDPRK